MACALGRVPAFLVLKLPVVQRCPLGTSRDQEKWLQSPGTVLSGARMVQTRGEERAGEASGGAIALGGRKRRRPRSSAWALAGLGAQNSGGSIAGATGSQLRRRHSASTLQLRPGEVRTGLGKVFQVAGARFQNTAFPVLALASQGFALMWGGPHGGCAFCTALALREEVSRPRPCSFPLHLSLLTGSFPLLHLQQCKPERNLSCFLLSLPPLRSSILKEPAEVTPGRPCTVLPLQPTAPSRG